LLSRLHHRFRDGFECTFEFDHQLFHGHGPAQSSGLGYLLPFDFAAASSAS
jgi:hypothetical protein